MARVALRLDNQFSDVIRQLFEEKDSVTGDSIFPTLADLMVFSAMVGRDKFDDCSDVKVSATGREISSDVIQNLGKDGVAYLLALDHNNDGNILREENEREMWDYLQNYAFLGLQQIEIWINDPGNASIEPKDIILAEMKKIASREGLHKIE
jgi:dnd system-associated protein 4